MQLVKNVTVTQDPLFQISCIDHIRLTLYLSVPWDANLYGLPSVKSNALQLSVEFDKVRYQPEMQE